MRMYAEYDNWSLDPVSYTVTRDGEVTVRNFKEGRVVALWVATSSGNLGRLDVNQGSWGSGAILPKHATSHSEIVFNGRGLR